MDDRSAAIAALDDALRSYDRTAAVERALDAVSSNALTVEALYDHLTQTLVETGAGWRRGTVEVWQEHLVTGIVRTVVESCAQVVGRVAPAPPAGVVVLAAVTDEYHDLGLRMLTDRFTLAGWRAHFLGATVPLDQLLTAVRSLDADAAVLSASTHFHRLRLRGYVDRLTMAQSAVRVWVTGSAFAHEHEGWDATEVIDPADVPDAKGR